MGLTSRGNRMPAVLIISIISLHQNTSWVSSACTGKKHDITELSSEAVNLISHATQERLRGLLEKLTTIARHRMTAYKVRGSWRSHVLLSICHVQSSLW